MSTVGYAQVSGWRTPAKADIPTQTEAEKDAMYRQLSGKDITAVMEAFEMKDTTGKTSYAYIPQVEKGTKYLLLQVPNGDKIAFRNNKLAAILPKQY